MPLSNYPYGFLAGVTIKGVPILQTNPGNVYWCDNSIPGGSVNNFGSRFSGASDQNPGTFQKPFATIAQALLCCSPGNGDIIIVKPGHIEVVNASPSTTQAVNMAPVYDPTGAIVVSNGGTTGYNFQLNVPNVAIVGLGIGNCRPMIIWGTATGANILVSAPNVSIQNFLFAGNFAAVVSGFTLVDASAITTTILANVLTAGTVTRKIYIGAEAVPTSANGILPGTYVLSQLTGTAGAAGTYVVSNSYATATSSATVVLGAMDFNIESCEMRDLGTALNVISLVTTSAGAGGSDGLRVANCRVNSKVTSAAGGTLVTLGASIDRMTVNDNYVTSAATATGASLVVAGANNMTNVEIGRNIVNHPTTVGTGIAVTCSGNASTGLMHENLIFSLATSAGLMITTGTGIGFARNFCTITGAADKQAIINPAEV